VVLLYPGLIHGLYWHTDAAAPLVLAETLRGDGDVVIPHFGFWTSLWWLVATRNVPGHVQLWEATGYAFALAGVGLLGWATSRVAGLWAGVTAAAAAVMVGPDALRSLLTVNFHVSTPFTAAVLAAYLVLLPGHRSRLLAALVGLLAGVNAASDPLLWVAGIAPFALAIVVFGWSTRDRGIALRGGLVVGVALLSAVVTNQVMHSLGFEVNLLERELAPLTDLGANTVHLGRIAALVGGANYMFPPGYPSDPLRPLVAVLVLCAIACTITVAVRFLIRRTDPVVRSYATYWASAVVLLGASIAATSNAVDLGWLSVNYGLTFALAAGAGVSLLVARSRPGQVVVALGVTIVGVSNLIGLAQGRAETGGGAIETYQRPLTALLVERGVTRGYAGYWDAQNLAWQSGMRLTVAPVWHRGDRLCPYRFFTIDSWFRERPGPTFLIANPDRGFVSSPPRVARDPREVHRFGPLTVYIFDYDLARHFPRARGPDSVCRT
jgi:hypothetical protein